MVSIVGSSATSGNWSCVSGVDDFGIGGTQPRKVTVSFYSSTPGRVLMESPINGIEARRILATTYLGAGLGTRYALSDIPYFTSR
jgi:hypothetical protein